jgi:hypothetical protein
MGGSRRLEIPHARQKSPIAFGMTRILLGRWWVNCGGIPDEPGAFAAAFDWITTAPAKKKERLAGVRQPFELTGIRCGFNSQRI